jgi:6-phosphofructokinase
VCNNLNTGAINAIIKCVINTRANVIIIMKLLKGLKEEESIEAEEQPAKM